MDCPSTSCHDCCSCDQLQEWRTLSKARGDFWSLTDVEGAWNFFFSPRGENPIFWNGRIVLSELCFQSPLPRASSASCSKGGRTALSGPWSNGPCHLSGAADAAAASRMEAGRSRSQNYALESHEHPTQETKNKTNSTEKVERLRDNQRGLSVVIYNRDCKMVN